MSTFDERLKKLNKEQLEAVETIDGPLLVIAGPGSGKTELLGIRVANILKQTDASPSNILCLTYTENGAENMRERLASIIGPDAYRVGIYTFHSFAMSIINKYPDYFFGTHNFKNISNLEKAEILENIFKALPYDNYFASYHPENGFSHLYKVQSTMSDLRRAGYSPEEFKEIILNNEKDYVELNKIFMDFPSRVTKNLFDYEKYLAALDKLDTVLGREYKQSLLNAVTDLGEKLNSGEKFENPMSEWKTKNLTKAESGEGYVLKDSAQSEKLKILADIYKSYRDAMYEKGLYDFDDMILEFLRAVAENKKLQSEIEEQYQYVLVDEFQDTSHGQMKMIKLITSNPVNEGRPNICAVGDDDQAIYKFQGAVISNIHDFVAMYRDVKIISLINNYRSHQNIIDLAREVIILGENRLEKTNKIDKNLKQGNKNIKDSQITIKKFESDELEYSYVAQQVKKLIDAGEKYEEIAILSRKNQTLTDFLPYMRTLNIPTIFQKRENALTVPVIDEIFTISIYVSSLLSDKEPRHDLLPQILSYPFFKLSRETIFEIAKNSKESNWFESAGQNPESKPIIDFLKFLAIESQSKTIEEMFDMIVGSDNLFENSVDENDDNFDLNIKIKNDKFTSPIKNYYFNSKNIQSEKYIHLVSALRAVVASIREYKRSEFVKLSELENFLNMHSEHNINITYKIPNSKKGLGIEMMSAHAAKGLEYRHVFVIGATENAWFGAKNNGLKLPPNIVASAEKENEDDVLRLLYVALTRAKTHLYITMAGEPIRYFVNKVELNTDTNENITIEKLQNFYSRDFTSSERNILQNMVAEYVMPVTHLNNFLNLERGGPEKFVEQNLLRFPQQKNQSSIYGSAIHASIDRLIKSFSYDGKVMTSEEMIGYFKNEIMSERINAETQKFLIERGEKALQNFYEFYKDKIEAGDKTEYNFKYDNIVLDNGKAKITGKIDLLKINNNTISVFDFKTGKDFDSLNFEEIKESTKKQKAIDYRRQLIFYHILLKNSREFAKMSIKDSGLIFVENDSDFILNLEANDAELQAEIAKTEKLISVVYNKIQNLDFPDVSKYKEKYSDSAQWKASLDFENDLLNDML
jgi:DNA helicase-2/ATP-dependent DNA helicase PcrA